MSHNIQLRDSQHGLKQAWHGLTQIPESGLLEKDVVFNYDIEKQFLYRIREGDDPQQHGQFYTPICTDDNLPIGNGPCLNDETYTLLTPHEVWDMLGELLDGTKHRIVSAGSVNNRSRYFITLELDGLDSVKVGDRRFNLYLNAISSMDRSVPLVVTNTSICTVCENTLLANFNQESWFKYKFKHNSKLKDNMENFQVLLEDTFKIPYGFSNALNILHNHGCDKNLAEKLFAGYIASVSAEEKIEESRNMATRLRNNLDDLLDLFEKGLGNKGETLLDVLSAFTQFHSRTDDPDKTEKVIKRDWDLSDSGAVVKKARFASNLLDTGKRNKMAERGENLLNIMPIFN